MRRPSGKALLFLFLLAAFGLLVFALARGGRRTMPPPTPPTPAPADRVRIGTMGRPATLPVWALGRLLTSRSLRLEVQTFEDPGVMWQMLAAGQLDLVLTTLDQFALAVPRHDPGVLLFPSARSTGSDAVVSRPAIKRPEDLQGKRIAYVDGTAGEYLVLNFLASHSGLAFETVAARNPDEAMAWLRRGDVAAAALWEPWVEVLRQDQFGVLWSSKERPLTEVWVASRQTLRGEGVGPEGLEAVASAWFSLIQQLRTAPGLAVKAIAEETGENDPGTLQVALRQGLEFLTLQEARAFDPQRLIDSLQALKNDWSLQGAFRPPQAPRAVEPASTVDFTLLQKLTLVGDPSLPAPPTGVESPAADFPLEPPLTPAEPAPVEPAPGEVSPDLTPGFESNTHGVPAEEMAPVEEPAPVEGDYPPGTRPMEPAESPTLR